jgi:hypothetical protein
VDKAEGRGFRSPAQPPAGRPVRLEKIGLDAHELLRRGPVLRAVLVGMWREGER